MKKWSKKAAKSITYRVKWISDQMYIYFRRKFQRIQFRNFDSKKSASSINKYVIRSALSENISEKDCKLLEETTLITWARSDFYDLIPVYNDCLKNNLPGRWKNIFVSNINTQENIAITPNKPFKWGMQEIIELCETNFVMFMQLDFLLLPGTNTEILDKAFDLLNEKEYDFFRVAYATDRELIKINEDFVEIDPYFEWFCNWLPTFWHKDRLKDFLSRTNAIDINQEDLYSIELREMGYKGFTISAKHREAKGRPGCKVMPHICTALNGGKWTRIWQVEIKELLANYKIEIKDRGWNDE